MSVYEYVGFDMVDNMELWRRCSWLRLHVMWLCDRLAGDDAARIGYTAWLQDRVTHGPLLLAEDLTWNQRVVRW